MLPPTLPLRGLVLLREAFPVISTCVLQKSEPAMAPEEGSGKLCRICISFYQKCAAELAVSSGRAGGSAPGLSPMQGSVSKSRIIQLLARKGSLRLFQIRPEDADQWQNTLYFSKGSVQSHCFLSKHQDCPQGKLCLPPACLYCC